MFSEIKNYKILSLIGQGSYGAVFKAEDKLTKEKYAVKIFNILNRGQDELRSVENETKILSKLNHNNIVKLYEYFPFQGHYCVVMELCENGDLNKLIISKKNNKQLFSENEIKQIFNEICKGLEYLHNNKIIHRDLKSMNIFLTKENHIKIGDFGISKQLKNNSMFAYTFVGTPYYLSPELCNEKPYDEKSDIWSLGCLLYEMITLNKPFDSNSQIGLIMKIIHDPPAPIPFDIKKAYSIRLINLVFSLLDKNPIRRFSIKQIFNTGLFGTPESKNVQKNQREIKEKVEENSNKKSILYSNKKPIKVNKEIVNRRVRTNPKNKSENKLSRRAIIASTYMKNEQMKEKDNIKKKEQISNKIEVKSADKFAMLTQDNEDNQNIEEDIPYDYDLSASKFMKKVLNSTDYNKIFNENNHSETIQTLNEYTNDNEENEKGNKVKVECQLMNQINFISLSEVEQVKDEEEDSLDNIINHDEIPILDDLKKASENIQDIEDKDNKLKVLILEGNKLIGENNMNEILHLYEKFMDNLSDENTKELERVIYNKCDQNEEKHCLFLEIFYKIIYIKYLKQIEEKDEINKY